jgi:pantetheine-phosphate adenylyltransferase
MALALYPGTFDPFTFGHLDVLERASRLFDQVEVTVAINASKAPLLSVEERCALIEDCTQHLHGVSVSAFEGLLVDRARERGAIALVRGLRQVSDFDYEFRMAFANRKLYPEVETVFFMTSEEHAMISASVVRDVHRWDGDLTSFVPPPVVEALQAKRAAEQA